MLKIFAQLIGMIWDEVLFSRKEREREEEGERGREREEGETGKKMRMYYLFLLKSLIKDFDREKGFLFHLLFSRSRFIASLSSFSFNLFSPFFFPFRSFVFHSHLISKSGLMSWKCEKRRIQRDTFSFQRLIFLFHLPSFSLSHSLSLSLACRLLTPFSLIKSLCLILSTFLITK